MKSSSNDTPPPVDRPGVTFEYARRRPRPRPAWVKLPVEDGRVVAYLPNWCCQCMAGGDTRVVDVPSVSIGLSVYLCPACRARWRRRTRQVSLSIVLGMVVAVTSATAVIVRSPPRPTGWLEIVGVASALIGAAGFLSVPLFHYFATPMIIGWPGTWATEVWVRFPNDEYVKKIESSSLL